MFQVSEETIFLPSNNNGTVTPVPKIPVTFELELLFTLWSGFDLMKSKNRRGWLKSDVF